jgi:hypothetical protein
MVGRSRLLQLPSLCLVSVQVGITIEKEHVSQLIVHISSMIYRGETRLGDENQTTQGQLVSPDQNTYGACQ